MHATRILSGDSMGEAMQAAAQEDLDAADRSALALPSTAHDRDKTGLDCLP